MLADAVVAVAAVAREDWGASDNGLTAADELTIGLTYGTTAVPCVLRGRAGDAVPGVCVAAADSRATEEGGALETTSTAEELGSDGVFEAGMGALSF